MRCWYPFSNGAINAPFEQFHHIMRLILVSTTFLKNFFGGGKDEKKAA
jgi:hypothetical protein